MMSEHINELALALSKAQGEMNHAEKDSKANYGKFASLSAVLNVIREPLKNNELSFSEYMVPLEHGTKFGAMLMHKSGQWIKSEIVMNPEGQTIQKLGAAITYYRRYLLCALIGVTQEDDDGDSAETAQVTQAQMKEKLISEKQLGMIKHLLKTPQLLEEYEEKLEMKIEDLSSAQASKVIEHLKAKEAKNVQGNQT